MALKYKVIIGVLATFSLLVVFSPLASFKEENKSDLGKMAESSKGWFSAFGSLIWSAIRSILHSFGPLGNICVRVFLFIFMTLQKAAYGFWLLLKCIWNVVVYIINGFMNGIAMVLSKMWERVKELFKIDFELNLSSLSGITKLLGNLIWFPIDKVLQIVKIILKMVGDIIFALFGGLGHAYEDLSKSVSEAFASIELPSLSAPFKRIVNGLARLGAAIKSIPLLSFFCTVIKMIVVLITGLVRTVVVLFVSVWLSLKQLFEDEKRVL